MNIVPRDLRSALRTLWLNPLFALSVVLTMAPGIGINTAMFSVVDALVLRPLPFRDLDRLVLISNAEPGNNSEPVGLTGSLYADLTGQTASLEKAASYVLKTYALTGGSDPRFVSTAEVSSDFFPILSTPPLMGSEFLGSSSDHSTRAVLSYGLWQERFGADRHIVGRSIELEHRKYTVAGVMPRQFLFPLGVQLWTALPVTAASKYDRSRHEFNVIAKLKPGRRLPELSSELTRIANRAAADHPDTDRGWSIRASPLRDFVTGGMTAQYVMFLMLSALIVMLIASSNVSNLLFARSAARTKEMAIRTALGASSGRIITLLMTESILLSVLGALLSLPLAYLSIHLIQVYMPASVARFVPGFDDISLNGPALAFAMLISVLGGLLAGLMPATWIARADLNEILKSGGRWSSRGVSHQKLRSVLLVGEVALAMALLATTGLMMKSLGRLRAINPRSDPLTLLTVRLELPKTRYASVQARAEFYSRLLSALHEDTQFQPAAIGSNIPDGGYGNSLIVTADDQRVLGSAGRRTARVESISPGYLKAMRIQLLKGRDLLPIDRPESMPVGMVSESLARLYWPGQNAIGKKISVDADNEGGGHSITVVGVVHDILYNWAVPGSKLALYLPYTQVARAGTFVVIRTANPGGAAAAIRTHVTRIDRDQPISTVLTWDRVISESMLGLSYVTVILTCVGILALTLAAVGLFGLMSYSVRLQMDDIGLRIALGAQKQDVMLMVVGRGILLTCSGLLIGLPAGFAAARLISSLIVGASVFDPWPYVHAAVLLLAVGLLASYFPSIAATQADATAVLRR